MADLSTAARNSVALQQEMFRLAEAELGLSLAVLARTRGISPSTLKGWRDGAAMPAWAIGALNLPDDITSLVLAPFQKHVGTDEDTEGDLDDAAIAGGELASAVRQARHPNSPGGIAIVHTEKLAIAAVARRALPKIRRAA